VFVCVCVYVCVCVLKVREPWNPKVTGFDTVQTGNI